MKRPLNRRSGRDSTLVLKPMSQWVERLPEKRFARIHRSTIINIEFIKRVGKSFNYAFEVYLRGAGEPFTSLQLFIKGSPAHFISHRTPRIVVAAFGSSAPELRVEAQ